MSQTQPQLRDYALKAVTAIPAQNANVNSAAIDFYRGGNVARGGSGKIDDDFHVRDDHRRNDAWRLLFAKREV